MYNSAILIKQPAIKQENGDFTCVTASTRSYTNLGGSLCVTEIPNVNPYVPDYWSTADTDGIGPTMRHVTMADVVTHVTRTKLKVALDRPFVYEPDWGTVSKYGYPARVVTEPGLRGPNIEELPYGARNPYHGEGYSDYGHEDYGYIPQVLIDYLSEDSGLSSALFQSISLYPGGPKFDPGNPCEIDIKKPFFGKAAADIHDSSEETINIAGCFHPGACPGANGPAVAVTTSAAGSVPQSASVPARINHSSPAVKTQVANIKTSLTAIVGAARSSDTGAAIATPQILPLQSSQTEQSNGGTPGQQLPPQPNNSPIATTQKFNGVTSNQQSPSQPDANPAPSAHPSIDGASGKKSSLQSSFNLKTPTQNLNGATFDQESPPQSGSNSAPPAQNANDGTRDQIFPLPSNSNFITSAQNFKEAISDQDVSSQPTENSVSSTQNSEDDVISPSHLISNFITSAQNFHKATSDQQPASQSDSNPISPAQNSNEDTQGRILSSQSKSNSKTSEQNFNEAKFDQQFSSQSNSNPTSPSQVLDDDLQGQILSSRPNSNLIASTQNVNKAKPDQQSSSQSNLNPASPASPASPAQNSNGGAQRQEFPSQPKPSPNLVTIVYVSSQLSRPKPTVFRNTSPIPVTIAEMPEVPKPAVAPVITVGPLVLTADSKQNFVISSRTLAPGSSPIVAFGTTLYLLPSASALIVNGITSPLTAAQTFPAQRTEREQNERPTLTSATKIDNQPLAVNSSLFVIVQGQTLVAGGTSIVAAGATFTLGPSGLAVAINGVTTALPAPDAVPSPAPTLTDNGRIIIANAPGQLSFGVQVLSLDGGLIAVSDIAGHDAAVIVNGMTAPLQVSGSEDVMTASLVHAIPELVIDGQTAIAGGAPVTVSGVPISLLPFGNEIVVGSSIEKVPSGPTLVLTLGTQIIKATKKNEYVVNDQTLTAGPVATVSGVSIHLAPNSNTLVAGKTSNDPFNARTTDQPEGGLFTGDGRTLESPMKPVVIGSILMILWIMVL